MKEDDLDMTADEIFKNYKFESRHFFGEAIFRLIAMDYPDITIKECVKIVDKIQDKIIGV